MAFSYSRAITVDHTKVPNTDQTNFPVNFSGTYSYLATVANGGLVTNSSGYDIGFYSDALLTTKLKWEMESYSATTGAVAFWIKIPSLSHTVDTVIYVGYGDASISTDQSDPTNVWDTSFYSVWHMKETLTAAGQTVADSTSAAHNMTSVGTWTGAQQVAGVVGGSLKLLIAGVDYLSYTALSLSGDFTIEGWAQLTANPSNDSMMFGVNGGMDTNWFGAFFRSYSGSGDEVVSGTSIAANAWHHFVITRTASGSGMVLYQDGVSAGTGFSNQTKTYDSLGRGAGGVSKDIYFDEVRISTSVRSADWVKTEYNNMFSPSTFYSIGSQQVISAGSLSGLYFRAKKIRPRPFAPGIAR